MVEDKADTYENHSEPFSEIAASSQREGILKDAIAATCGDRNKTYGPPLVQMSCAAELIDTYRRYRRDSGRQTTTAHDVAIEDALEKISHIACGVVHRDNYVDSTAYLAIAWEVLSLEEKRKTTK